MKNSFLLLCLFITSFTSAQTELEKGEFSSTSKTEENLKFIIHDNNKFYLSVFSGTFEQVKDSIIFHSERENQPRFKVQYANPNPRSKKITVKMDGKNIFYASAIFLGTQESRNNEIVYRSIKEYLNINTDFDYTKESYSFEIDYPFSLFLAEDNPSSESIIEQYEVPKNVSEITINISEPIFSKLKLKGFYNPKNQELTVSEGKIPMVFSKNITQAKYENPVQKQLQKNWTFPGKPIDEYAYGTGYDSTATYGSAQHYKLKLTIENSLKEALKSAQSQKEKFLVIVYDPNNKNAVAEFKRHIESYQTEAEYSMYDGYNPEFDRFNFYLANSKDKAAIKKYGIAEGPALIFLNAGGTKIYHTQGEITDDVFSSYNLIAMYSELKPLNAHAKLDALMLRKNTPLEEVKQVLTLISKEEVPYQDASYPAEPVAESQGFGTEKTEAVVDQVADTAYEYTLLKQKANKYQLKTSAKAVNDKWKQLLESKNNDTVVDEEIVKIIIKEINNTGFNKLLFKKDQLLLDDIGFRSLDYILAHYDAIQKIKTPDYEYESTYTRNYLRELVTGVLDKNLSPENNPSAIHTNRILTYYKKYATLINDAAIARNYMMALKTANSEKEYLNAYANYFSTVIKDNSSVIEQLDTAYKNENAAADWTTYKNEFANMANESAWYVVEKTKSPITDVLKKAIRWSETSLKIENSHYYLDTLAQLYYKNGEKEKAILTEQKAIDLANGNDEETTEYKMVLEKMKNGTY